MYTEFLNVSRTTASVYSLGVILNRFNSNSTGANGSFILVILYSLPIISSLYNQLQNYSFSILLPYYSILLFQYTIAILLFQYTIALFQYTIALFQYTIALFQYTIALFQYTIALFQYLFVANENCGNFGGCIFCTT